MPPPARRLLPYAAAAIAAYFADAYFIRTQSCHIRFLFCHCCCHMIDAAATLPRRCHTLSLYAYADTPPFTPYAFAVALMLPPLCYFAAASITPCR